MLSVERKREVKDRTRGTALNESDTLRRGRAVASHRAAKPERKKQFLGCGSACSVSLRFHWSFPALNKPVKLGSSISALLIARNVNENRRGAEHAEVTQRLGVSGLVVSNTPQRQVGSDHLRRSSLF
jgi:hypothetical protein